MENVLNPALFYSLRTRFGSVKIANQGIQHQSIITADSNGRPRNQVLEPGEHYRVCCPYCSDTRFRLYIGYTWNTIDQMTKRRTGRFLAHCFNEECDMSNLDNELRVYMQYNTVIPKTDVALTPIRELFPEVKLPGECQPLSTLGNGHAAIEYILKRDFDPGELDREWGLQYCVHAERDEEGFIPGTRVYANLVKGRIIIPITWQHKLVGWQARSLNPDEKHIKYYTMPGLNKNYMLFNGDRARLSRFGVVVEGAFDAFRVGPRAVALLGSSMSAHQRALISAFWSTGAMILLLDPDAVEDMDNMAMQFLPGTFRWGSFSIALPDNNDPADMNREALWSLIVSFAHSRKVPLTSV